MNFESRSVMAEIQRLPPVMSQIVPL